MRVELAPIDSGEGTWWEVPQECDGLTEEYEPCSCIYRYGERISERKGKFECTKTKGSEFNTDDCDEDTERDCDEWKDDDSERSDTP